MLGGLSILESHDESFGAWYRPSKILFDEDSEFQRVTVFDTARHGKIMLLDNLMMFTEHTHHVYHELMAHVPLSLHRNPKRVLVVGGGDGGVVSELVKYDAIEQIDVVEIDRMVTEVSRRYFPDVSRGLSDDRVRVVFADAGKFLKQDSPGAYDVVIVDSTDPYIDNSGNTLAGILVSDEFYRAMSAAVAPGSICIQISGHAYYERRALTRVWEVIQRNWDFVRPVRMAVPFYISGEWISTLYSKSEPGGFIHRLDDGALQYCNRKLIEASLIPSNDLVELMSRTRPPGRRRVEF